jgi:hypothetical protein
MDNSQERDFSEESYNRDLCPECDHSPCRGPEVCPTGKWTENTTKQPLPPMVDGTVIGYIDLEEGSFVLDGGEWWNNR